MRTKSVHDQEDAEYGIARSVEMTPIMITDSEDEAEIFLDETDAELQRIRAKYENKRNSYRGKMLRIFAMAATAVLLLSLSLFAVIHAAGKHKHNPKRTKINGSGGGGDGNLSFPVHPSFKRIRSKNLPAYQASMHLYQHVKTQAEFIAYVPLDETQDKTFGISFRTKPTSDNGIAHILEHSVLSGSKKYPSKDPFLALSKGSLNTFLNAMTYNDRTVYPIASRNKKDYMNLMGVYLDAVFAPKCVEDDGSWVLKQEGWRYDTEDDDDDQNLIIKGVVYSEMKGVYSNPLSLLNRQTDKYLFPDNTYHYDSGGDPTVIPTLTQEEFRNFYHKHYHPTNSKIFVSGTVLDAMDSMDLIDSYLQQYEYDGNVKKESEITFQMRDWNHHLYQSMKYSVQSIEEEDTTKGQHMFCITWLLNDTHMHMRTQLAFYVLDYLLIGTASSPLYKRLMESGYGSSFIGNGFGPGLMQSTFAIGMKDVRASDIIPLETLIMQILEDVASEGFSDDDIEAAMNSIEFQLREVHTGSQPAGITMFLQMLTKWNYDLDPESAVEFEGPLKYVKKKVEEKGSHFFMNLIKRHLIKCNHRVHLQLVPSETLEAEIVKEEHAKVKAFQNTLTPESLEAIKDEAKALKLVQETDDTPEVLDKIPTLELSDLDREGVEYDLSVLKGSYKASSTIAKNVVSGSPGIVYIDVGIDVSSLDYRNVDIFPFVLSMLGESDTKSKTRVELDRLEGMYTGGISLDLELMPLYRREELDYVVSQNTHMRSLLFFRGKCTVEKTERMLNLIKELVEDSLPVSQEKAIQILQRKISRFETGIVSSGHAYSVKKMHSRYDVQAFLNEKLNGITQLHALEGLLDKAQNNWASFEKSITAVMSSFSKLYAGETIINLTGDEKALVAVEDNIEAFVSSMADSPAHRLVLPDFYKVDHPWMEKAINEMQALSPLQDEGIPISSQVSYIGKSGLLYHEGEKVSGNTCAPMQFLRKGYLWDTVRAKNGAYGVMASLDKMDGSLYMVSYRDPQVSKTVDVFDNAGTYLVDELTRGSIMSKDIQIAIIGCIGALDGSALPPRDVGWIALNRWISRSSPSRRQKWRDEILDTKFKDFKDFSERLLNWENATVAAIAPKSALNSSGLDLVTIDL